MLREIRDLGFEYAELSHGIRLSLVPGILDAVAAGEIKISSLHNFCPLPIGLTHAAPNVFKCSALDARERENCYKHSIKTLDLAQRVGARLVVLHLGAIEMRDYTDRLLDMVGAGMREHPKFQRLCAEAEETREALKDRHYSLVYDFLSHLEVQAAQRGLILGIENREAIEELPFEADFSFLLADFPKGVLRYWHDLGHAQIKQNLGFIDHVMHLESLADLLAGFHIHDVEFPGRDHRPPGKGMIDFASIKPFVKPEHLKVIELSPSVTPEELQAGLAHLQTVWGAG